MKRILTLLHCILILGCVTFLGCVIFFKDVKREIKPRSGNIPLWLKQDPKGVFI